MSDIQSLIKRAEETKNKDLYIEIGHAFFYGKNVNKNVSQAFTYYKKAADLGSTAAKCAVGEMYYKGIGVNKDAKAAKKYLLAAADEGYIQAFVILGWMCYDGEYGLFAAKGKAFDFWMKAAKKGNAEAQCYVGTSYLGDEWGEEKSYRKAAFWFMCAYQNRKAGKNQIAQAKEKLNALANHVNLESIKNEIVRKYPEYINL